jgi:hypothetical protein
MDKFSKGIVKRLRKVRSFPTNTCPYSRHVQMIGENLVREKPYPMLQEEPEHCGGSMLATVLALYEARTQLAEADALLSCHADKIDANPRTAWPKGSILAAAISRHEERLSYSAITNG